MYCLFTFVRARAVGSILAVTILSACDAPRDPEGSSQRITATHELRAGASENRPWIWFEGGRAYGPEARLIEDFAAGLGAQVRWVRQSETPLVALLAARKLDLGAGGFMSDTQWAAKVGTSRPYAGGGLLRPGHILLAATGENQLLLRLDRFLNQRGRQGHD